MRFCPRTILAAALLALPFALSAQRKDRSDSLVTLISAQSAQLIEEGGEHFRKVIGPAKFFHNNTYLLCDTAYWNVDTQIIKALGHVKILQDRTTLTSESLEYVIDEDLAKFRGQLVQLQDKDKNTLRTRYLDYNTKDSIAVFQSGGSMRDHDGQIIESRFGSYDGKEKTFTFMDHVNMFADSTFVKTSRLVYNSDESRAYFGYGTDAWQDENMLSADDGWFQRDIDLFFFRKKVHVLTQDQEAWTDSLFYNRATGDVRMLGNAEIMDTTRNVYGLAGQLVYVDSLSEVTMTRKPAIMSISESEQRKDTVYFGGDTLVYRTFMMFQIDTLYVPDAKKRLEDMEADPVSEFRRKAAEAAAKAAEEAAMNDPNRPPDIAMRKSDARTGKLPLDTPSEEDAAPVPVPADTSSVPVDSVAAPVDSLAVPSDSLSVPADSLAVPMDSLTVPLDSLSAPLDSLSAPSDSLLAPSDSLLAPSDTLEGPKDSTKVGFLWATGNVKLFREDIQMVCDSLVYCDLDSLARLYIDPIVYNEGNRQYSADSIFVRVRNEAVDKASLMSNSFITTMEDTLHFDQIRGAEMLAYFDSTGTLSRFDALGGATALFFLREEDVIATVNKVDAKMIYALFRDGDLDNITYFEDAKNDAYPVVQLPKEDSELKGFRWDPDRRPKGREDITPLEPRPSQRNSYLAHPRADYPETAIYFPGYMNKIYKEMAKRDSLEAVRSRERALRREADPEIAMMADSLATADSLSLEMAVREPVDSVSAPVAPVDSLGTTIRDTVSRSSNVPAVDPKVAAKEAAKAERERIKAEKQAAREARWAELDRKDAEKAAAKEAKKLAKKRKETLEALKKQQKRSEKEQRTLRKYMARYQKQKERRAARAARKVKPQQTAIPDSE
ncbi:MAG: hypothetical protein IJM35_08775 [Bacteroidales bacterium]|nr:hypothetical protein [Bacteroidales bacterium]